MNDEPTVKRPSRLALLRNWISLLGLGILLSSLFAFVLLFLLDSLAHFSNPYVGVLTYLVAPIFSVVGIGLGVVGMIWRRFQLARTVGAPPALQIDLTRARDRRIFGFFLVVGLLFLLLTAIGSYHSYHFTESTQFCGATCHTVMQPERTTYQHSPHARVACAECHIGRGASWYVRSKLSGAYQVYATLFDKYPRPVPTPIKNLRPAQETCEQCHWPAQFVGNLDRTFTHFLSDATNPVYSVRLLLKVGGADPTHGPVGGIHWHMNVGNTIEYYASDASRQKIPWVRVTDRTEGVVTEYHTPDFTNAPNPEAIRVMDCMDCHNRPAHVLRAPNDAVDLAMSLHDIDTSLPYIKTNAAFALVRPYTNLTEALEGIATFLDGKYPNDPRIRKTIPAVQQIYKDNFFPEMNARWQVYPDNVGHKDWPGCFRCHDGKHKTSDGKREVKADDCNACHIIVAQGNGPQLEQLDAHGQKFEHPGGDYDKGYLCNDCHTGGP